MIKKISLTNFKSFKELKDIELKNITVIAGKNSCGKSSILQSLLLLKQTLESSNDAPICLEGKYIKCSNIKEITYGLPPVNQAKFGYEFSLMSGAKIKLSFKNKSVDDAYVPTIDSISVESEIEDILSPSDLNRTKLLKAFKKRKLPFDATNLDSFEIKYDKFIPESVVITVKNDEGKTDKFSLPWFIFAQGDEYHFDELNRSLKNIKYLSPVRAIPERAYVHYSADSNELNEDGSNSAHILWSKRNAQVLWKGEEVKLKDALNSCISCMGLSQQISPERVGEILYKVGIVEQSSGSNVSLADVGFGYSQILPVILLGLINKPKNLMLLEQPEIHLHPSSAANLADLFINFASDGKKFVIETHSQEMINRLRLRVIENPELKEMINIVFVESDNENGAQASQFQIDEQGMFPAWPDGFLDESKKIADAIIKARLAKASDEW
ncbi:AAA family ATPase [Vibrio cholerae]|uniref:AAA family ATPase n=1 Tax=Vibrio cholerae TaxID=666 RepID=UPI00061554FD|nr:AAA family ATPase [Vibrio cholerae]AKB05273.1 AAA domain protein [Vibrio cholerae]GHZ02669.1 AAA domain protein [Vibrio cholerae]